MFGHKKIDTSKLPVFVHALQSADAFMLAEKVWEVNAKSLRPDPGNDKEFMRFSFSNPACTVWLQRDKDRSDTFELILVWEVEKESLTEVYVISALASQKIGDDKRAKDLLDAILTAPSVVPVNN